MKTKIKEAIESHQCPGCVVGSDIECFEANHTGVGCGKHVAGTRTFPGVGKIYLGMPTGFNRLGPHEKMNIYIFETFESSGWKYNMFNIPAWKYLNDQGHTIVRGLMPRRNEPFLHIFLENCMDKIDCIEIKDEDINQMD